MNDLITWLRAQLDDDEQVARATVPGGWRISATGLDVMSDIADITVMENFDDPGPWHRALPGHVTRWDPARVLAEVDAKRRILDAYEWASTAAEAYPKADPGPALVTHWWAVRVVALPYADRPGYREEWRP